VSGRSRGEACCLQGMICKRDWGPTLHVVFVVSRCTESEQLECQGSAAGTTLCRPMIQLYLAVICLTNSAALLLRCRCCC
jgi:hypothetical protein